MIDKQVNVKTMSEMSEKDLIKLLEGLKDIDGFNFFVDSQFMIKNEEKS